jgi:hypothetical protein
MDTTERGNPNVCDDCIRWSEDASGASDTQTAKGMELPKANVDSVKRPARRRNVKDNSNSQQDFWITLDPPRN